MILKIDGSINRYYVQTLCMVFFPGATFSESEQSGPDVPEVTVSLTREGDTVRSVATMRVGDKETRGEGASDIGTDKSAARAEKIAVGRAVFAAGKAFFSYTPPWGILTGVRPAKVASELIAKGNGIRNSRAILRDQYFLNPRKAALAVSVASTEMKLTQKLPSDLCSVYVSIPFCPSRCAYCSFVSYTSGKLLSLIDEYLLELYRDIDDIFATIRELGLRVATVYIGGGTPTVLSPLQMSRLLECIGRNVDPSTLLEFTVEAGRPDTITREKLDAIREGGAGRISVNPQTLSDDVLRSIGRHHTVEEFYRAFATAREAGIGAINVDMIAGLPEDTFRIFSESLDKVMDLTPENITVHTFCVKRSAALRQKDGIYALGSADAAKSVEYSQMQTKLLGYRPYYMYRQKNTVGNLENVGYALPGTEGLYNIFMMEELHSIFAVGAGAVTKLVRRESPLAANAVIERIFMPKYPYEYLRDAARLRDGDAAAGLASKRERILSFFKEKENDQSENGI